MVILGSPLSVFPHLRVSVIDGAKGPEDEEEDENEQEPQHVFIK
jgi:hypothetical protein